MLFLFFMSRHLKQREEDTLMREPTWLRQIESPTSLEAARGGRRDRHPAA